jgi:hypothetical protein
MSNAELTLQTGTEAREVFRLAPGESLKEVTQKELCKFYDSHLDQIPRAFSFVTEGAPGLAFVFVGVESATGWKFQVCRKTLAERRPDLSAAKFFEKFYFVTDAMQGVRK